MYLSTWMQSYIGTDDKRLQKFGKNEMNKKQKNHEQ